MTTAEVANQLVALCKQFKNFEAMETLYADDIVSVEATPSPRGPLQTVGKGPVIKKSADWAGAHEIHGASVEGPFVAQQKFAVIFDFEVTEKATGKRMKQREVGVYTVADGKITREEFLFA